jgi:Tol biopolymer transport system component/DNA-binding winged helix-turn-helix (wHTH) protein
MEGTVSRGFTFEGFEIDAEKRLLLKGGEIVPLQSKAFDLLTILVSNHGKVLSKSELLDTVWEGQFVEENNLTVHITSLRKALGESKKEHRFIATVPGKGYRFVADVQPVVVMESAATANLDQPLVAQNAKIIVETHKFERFVIEEEIESNVTAEPEKAIAAEVISISPELIHKQRFWLQQHRLLIAGLTLVLALLGTAGYFWQRQQMAKNYVPFQHISINRLTSIGSITNAALSPDGKLFAYTIGDKTKTLLLGHTAGGEPIELRPAADVAYRSLRFSPDSSRLYYVIIGKEYPTGALFRMSVFGSVPEKLRENVKTQIAFAPDMKQFAVVRNYPEKDASTLVIADTDSSAERELVSRPMRLQFQVLSPAWSADGKTIAISTINDTDNGVNYEVYTVAVVNGQLKQLTNQNFRMISTLTWFADGSGLMMPASKHPQTEQQLWFVSYPAGETHAINPDLNNYRSSLGISTDGKRLLAVTGEYLSNIWIAPATGATPAKQITFSAMGGRYGRVGLEWMPDGRIIYVAYTGKSESLWMMNGDGSHQKQLTPSGFIDLDPSATADGQVIVFNSNRSGSFEVWRVSADGSGLRQLTFDSSNEMPGVSPDGKWVVYISTRDGLNTLWRIPLVGGEPIKLSDRPTSWCRVSPDSRFVACGYDDNGKTKLAVLPIEGGDPVKIFDLPASANLRYALRWTADGAALTYRDWENGIWRQPLSGGAAQRIENLPEEKLFAYDWSPDGKQIAFTRGLEIRDVVLIENTK